jgi:hypothetical protein
MSRFGRLCAVALTSLVLAVSCGAPAEDGDVLDARYFEGGEGTLPSWQDPDGDGFPTEPSAMSRGPVK